MLEPDLTQMGLNIGFCRFTYKYGVISWIDERNNAESHIAENKLRKT